MENFFESTHCRSRVHCKTCRDLKNKEFRESLIKTFGGLDKIDFECPFNVPWNFKDSQIKIESNMIRIPPNSKIFTYADLEENIELFKDICWLDSEINSLEKQASDAECTGCKLNKLKRNLTNRVVEHLINTKTASILSEIHENMFVVTQKTLIKASKL